MKAIYKKEVKSYLTSMIGYVFIFFILLLEGIYFTAYNLQNAYPLFGTTLSAVTFIFLILVPVLTMKTIAEERKQKTDQLLLTAPVSVSEIVLGKFLAVATVYVIPVLIICLYPMIMGKYGTISYAMAYTAVLGFALLGFAQIAVGVFWSSVTENPVIAAVVTFIVLFVCYMITGISSLIPDSSMASLACYMLLVLLAEAMFLYSYTRSYYNSVQQTMYRRFSSVTGQLKVYTADTVYSAAANRSMALRRMVEQYSDKDKYEFMLLDSYGGVIASSSGTSADGIVTGTDFEQAQEASDGLGVAVYRTQSGELVMAACYLVPYAAEDVAAMRLVTSLTLVGAQIKNAIAVSVVIAAVILAFTVMSGLYFIRSIVVPLGQVERTAASIARGELDVRLPVTGDERDEVDRLRGTINQMAEGLEETEKMKNEFISSVSHELRTPLTSIRGWVETLRTLDDPADENYRKGLEIINNETGRLYNMVEELLDFSRLQNGRIRMDCRPLDLVAELTDAVLFCEARIQREGLVLSYSEPEEMIPVYADPDRLRQVFINILDNAIKYSAPGGRITVKLWAGEYKAFVEILDQGRGIPPEDLENVKTKFYKGSNSVRGSGIGLALVDSIMTALDGTMDIKSTLGRGTVVTLGLPLYHKA